MPKLTGRATRTRHPVPATLGAAFIGWPIAAAVLPSGLPPGAVVQGAIVGALAGLTAMALVLLYRSSRIINFAQIEIGAIGATLAMLLVTRRHVSYFVAVPLGLVVSVATGALAEILFVRRLFRAPRLILTTATIGIAQIVAAGSVFLQDWIQPPSSETTTRASSALLGANFQLPGSFRFLVDPISFTGDAILAAALIPLVVLGLVWFFNRTDNGIGIRGAADSQQRALLLGIPVRRLSVITWSVAGGLSGLSAMLTASVLGFQTGSGSLSGPEVLLLPLAAAVIARFDSLPVAMLASIGLNVLTEAVYWNWSNGAVIPVTLFVVILLALLVNRREMTRVAGEELGGFTAAASTRALPSRVYQLPELKYARLVTSAALVATAVLAPLALSNSQAVILTFAAIFAIVGISLVILTGWAGQIALGQFAFVGLGAAVTSGLLVSAHADYTLCLVAAIAVGGLSSAVIGVPALRVPGLFLAPVTLAFAVAVSAFVLNSDHFPALNPRLLTPPVLLDRYDLAVPKNLYYFVLMCLAIVAGAATWLRRSRAGRVILAVRDNERMAASFSVAPARTRIVAFAISGAIAGFAGSLYVVAVAGMPVNGFSASVSMQAFGMVVVGGLGSVLGGVLGAGYIYTAEYFIHGPLQLFVTGAGLLVVLLLFPGGLAQGAYTLRDRWIARVLARRGLEVEGFDFEPLTATWRRRIAKSAGRRRQERGQRRHFPLPAKRAPGYAEFWREVRTDQPLLSVQQACAHYDHLKVLFDVNVDIHHGEILGVMGTNGAGKSTLLKLAAGVLACSSGQVLLNGVDVTHLGAVERVKLGIVVVPPKGVFGSLTVEENLRLAGWLGRRAGRGQEVQEHLDLALELFPSLEQRLHQRASLLSGGEQQMLALAQGIVCLPRLLLIDELSLGLAPIVVSAIVDAVRKLRDAGVTVAVVEQSINLSTSMASRALFMEKGQVRFDGSADTLKTSDLLRSVFIRRDGKPPVAASRPKLIPIPGAKLALALRDVSKSYGSVRAVTDLNLDVYKGQILGVIGPNGAGKTTMFDLLSGYVVPDVGRIELHGTDVTRSEPYQRARLGLGRTFQDVRLMPSLTVSESIAVALERHIEVKDSLSALFHTYASRESERAVRKRVQEVIEVFGLGRYADAFMSDLSTGTRRIVELACSSAHMPSVLLLDEPTSGLAQREAEAMGEELVELRHRMNATLVIIEHDVPLVAGMSDELVCLDLGTVVARGRPDEVLRDSRVAAAYLGNQPAEDTDPHVEGGSLQDMLTTAEYAALSGHTQAAVLKMIRTGSLNAERNGRRYLIARRELV